MTIEESITKRAKQKFDELNEMSHTVLCEAFLASFGFKPHPRLVKLFMVKALTFKFQQDMYATEVGYVPAEVRRTVTTFWNTNAVPFLDKDGTKDDRGVEMARGRCENVKPTTSTKPNTMGIQASTITVINPTATVSDSYRPVLEILVKSGGILTFGELEKKSRKVIKEKTFNLPATVVLLATRKIIDVKVDSEVVVDSEIVIEEEPLPSAGSIIARSRSKSTSGRKVVMGEANYHVGDKTTKQVASAGRRS